MRTRDIKIMGCHWVLDSVLTSSMDVGMAVCDSTLCVLSQDIWKESL